MPLDFAANIFTGPNGTGSMRLVGAGGSTRYDSDNGLELMYAGFFEQVRSVQLSTSSQTEANFLIFSTDGFSGSFAQLVLPKGGGSIVRNCGGFKTRSLATIATRRGGEKEIRRSARQDLQKPWIDFIDVAMAGKASRDGPPSIRWLAFPTSPGLDPGLVYLMISQALVVDVPKWPFDYAASLAYVLLPFIDGAGHVRVWGVMSSWWVESGLVHDKVEQALKPKVISGLATLVTKVNNNLMQFDALGKAREVYLLPGNQVGPTSGETIILGNADDDATVVVVI